MQEFAIIDSFFRARSHQRRDVEVGIGDDCAVTQVPEGQSLCTTTDTLVEGVHFPKDAPVQSIAEKAMAVNLSDLAAMGAEPAWVSLSLSLPEVDETWLNAFSNGIQQMCEYYGVQLIGGDTVRGPLMITITAQGFVPKEQALTRSHARPGEWLYVTGTLGDAGLALDYLKGKRELPLNVRTEVLGRFHTPTPRVLTGTALRRIASSCIDVSDGLLADLHHILHASGCGATIQVEKLPLSEAMQVAVPEEEAIEYALNSGDDYELLFTVSEEQRGNLEMALAAACVSATCIGQMNGKNDKVDLRHGEHDYATRGQGYQHFS